MTFSDTAMMELGITQSTNIHNTRSLIRTLKYVLDILQTEEAFTVEEYKHTHTYTQPVNLLKKDSIATQPVFACSKLTTDTLKNGMTYVQS